MSILEMFFAFIAVVITATLVLKNQQNLVLLNVLLIFEWVLLFSHFFVDGWRWPMMFMYMTAIVHLVIIVRLAITHKPIVKRKARTISIVSLLIVGIALPSYLFPWNTHSQPTGSYDVGTMTFPIVDEERMEKWTEDNVPRKLVVQLWYPTDVTTGLKRAKQHDTPSIFMKDFGQENGIPGFLLQSFVNQKTYAYEEAELSNEENEYPIVLFSHGFGSSRIQSQFQVIELASHGYIVMGIDHTYYSSGTVFPNGEHIEPANIEFSEEMSVMDEYVREWSADARATMDWIEKVNQDGDVNGNEEDTWLHQLKGNIDLERVGYMGHSFGGATAGHTLATDDRFHAGINLDGFPYGEAHLVGVEQPFLTMMTDRDLLEEYLQETDEEYKQELYSRIEIISDEIISLDGALHMDFSDFPLLSPLTSWIGMTGRVSAKEQHQKSMN